MGAMIDLSKGNTDVALLDSNGQPADKVDFTVFWRAKTAAKGWAGKLKGATKVDLDLSVICYDAAKRPVAVCNDDSSEPFSGKALLHTGDTKSGRGGGEQSETVKAILSGIPQQMAYLAVVVNSYKGHTFESVNQLRLLLEDRIANGDPVEIAQTYLPIQGMQNAALMAVLKRTPAGGWTVAPRDHIFTGGADWLSVATPIREKL